MIHTAVHRSTAPARGLYACPICAGKVTRMKERWLDLFLGTLIRLPLRRYSCRNRSCSWRGNLALASALVRPGGTGPRCPGPLL